MLRVHEKPRFERPREKLYIKGAPALSDVELMTNILGNGIKGKDVIQIARQIIRTMKDDFDSLSPETLLDIEGVGKAQACRIMSAIELTRRFSMERSEIICGPGDIMPLVKDLRDKMQEHFVCISLNGANEVIQTRTVTVGLLNSSQVHPREVFADVIADRGASVILVHNHPSGSLSPSESDIQITNQLVEAGKILGISVLDHVIVSKKGHTSLKEQGFM